MRREIIYLVVALAALLAVYLGVRTDPTGPEAGPGGPLLPEFDAAQAGSLSVHYGGETVSLHRSERGWLVALDGAGDAPADPVMVERALAALSSLDRDEPVSVVPDKHGIFGVDESSALVARAGRAAAPLAVGGRADVGDAVYVRRLDEDEVYLAPGAVRDALPTDPEAWRDLALVRLNVTRVVELVYRSPDEDPAVVAVTATGEGWRLVEPERGLLHPRPPEIVLRAIAAARAEELLDPTGTPRGRREYTLSLTTREGRETVLEVFDAGEDHVIRVEGRGLYRLGRERFDLIERTILSFLEESAALE